MPLDLPAGVAVAERPAGEPPSIDRVLTPAALSFVAALERAIRPRRAELLARRHARQRDLDAGVIPGFLVETRSVRDGDWQVAPTPPALERRRVEITGPVERKMMINALNSGADCFMADFEDALSPTWENVVEGQANVHDFVRGALAFTAPDGRGYAVNAEHATLILRPRGWHLDEAHLLVDGAPVSASLFDFGLAFFHNAAEQLSRGAGPYFYLPKLESHLEARLWNDVFTMAQERVGVPYGSVRATVLIETVLAAFEMDEILYELRDHAAGLNAGRWDYIFSVIKKFGGRPDMVLPDRAQLTMTVPFMRAYTELLVRTCHRRGAHAMGGMAAFVPNRRDAAVTAAAVAKVRDDKLREAADGFDGTWVAHPDLVPVAMEVFRDHLGDLPNQKGRRRDDVHPDANALTRLDVPDGRVTEDGVRANVDVALQYVDAWLRGTGAVAIHDLMEDAATAEIARAQLWQWVRHRVVSADGQPVTAARYATIRDEVLATLERARGDAPSRLRDAAALLDDLVLGTAFTEFLTIPAYAMLEAAPAAAAAFAGSDAEQLASTGSLDEARVLAARWQYGETFGAVVRGYSAADVIRLRGSIRVEHTLARAGATRLRELLSSRAYVASLAVRSAGAAVDLVRAGLEAVVLTGRGSTGADAPSRVRQANDALLRADRVEWSRGIAADATGRRWNVPIVAGAPVDGGAVQTFAVARALIEAGAAAVQVDDRLARRSPFDDADESVLMPTAHFVRAVIAARLAADALDVPDVIVAHTVAMHAALLSSDVDERDRPFTTGERTAEGHHVVRAGLDQAIARAVAAAPYADLVSYDAPLPDLASARRFAQAVHAAFPGKPLAYRCTPTAEWRRRLDAAGAAALQRELAAIGYRLQVVALDGPVVRPGAFDVGRSYRDRGMAAFTGPSETRPLDDADDDTSERTMDDVDLVRSILGGTSEPPPA